MKDSTRKFVVDFARSAIENFVGQGKVMDTPKDLPDELNASSGVFVTLYKNGNLRGCIGVPYPVNSTIENLKDAAISATMDPRFPPMEREELKDMDIEVSVLTGPKIIKAKHPSEYPNKIRKGVDGLIIKRGRREGLFLPQVWKEIPDETNFLDNLCMKAGLMPSEWKSDGIELYRFEVEKITEKN